METKYVLRNKYNLISPWHYFSSLHQNLRSFTILDVKHCLTSYLREISLPGLNKLLFIIALAGNWTRVCTVGGYYSTTKLPMHATCKNTMLIFFYWVCGIRKSNAKYCSIITTLRWLLLEYCYFREITIITKISLAQKPRII